MAIWRKTYTQTEQELKWLIWITFNKHIRSQKQITWNGKKKRKKKTFIQRLIIGMSNVEAFSMACRRIKLMRPGLKIRARMSKVCLRWIFFLVSFFLQPSLSILSFPQYSTKSVPHSQSAPQYTLPQEWQVLSAQHSYCTFTLMLQNLFLIQVLKISSSIKRVGNVRRQFSDFSEATTLTEWRK